MLAIQRLSLPGAPWGCGGRRHPSATTLLQPCQAWVGSPPAQGLQQDGGRQGCIPEPGVGKGYSVLLAVVTCCMLLVGASLHLLRCKRVGGRRPATSEAASPKPSPFWVMESPPPMHLCCEGAAPSPLKLPTSNPLHPTLALLHLRREGEEKQRKPQKEKKIPAWVCFESQICLQMSLGARRVKKGMLGKSYFTSPMS